MTWSQEISQLITDVDQLTSAANVKKSVIDASVASTEADKNAAATSVVSATASFASASTKAQEAEAHKNTALAIYGTTTAQQTAVASTQASATLSSGYAASASAALQQDLSSITAQALHRSPNATTAMFIYDTGKDSDGGAWTEKCQNTSWYNEPICSRWLGPQLNEVNARYEGATLGTSFGDIFTSATGYTVSGGAAPTVSGAWFQFNPAVGSAWASKDYTTVVGRRYRVTGTFRKTSSNATFFAGTGSGAANLASLSLSNSGTFILYFNATTTTTNVGLQTTAGTLIEFQLGNLVEVLSVNTTSGDYYQSTADGKFYRLWKNLLTGSEAFNTAWSPRAGATVLPNTVAAPDGTMTADTITFTASINDGLTQNVLNNAGPHGAATFSVWARVESGTRVFRLSAYNGGVGTNTSGDFTATTTWQRFSFTTFFAHALGVQQCNIMNMGTSPTVGNLIVWGAQLEHGSAATSYEPKTTIGTISEVTRGNKRDFPRLAGIITDWNTNGDNRITIYDLTEPGRPMWMAAASVANNYTFYPFVPGVNGVNPSSISALNGIVSIGFTGIADRYGFLRLMRFPVDSMQTYSNGSNKVSGVGIAKRNTTEVGFLIEYAPAGSVSPGIVNGMVNSVAMTVMPDAPIDPATGLKIPTIAVATGAGVSLIKHDGTIVSGDGQGTNNIAITPNIMTWFNTAFTAARYLLNPGKATAFTDMGSYNQSTMEFGANNNTQRDIAPKRGLRLRSLTGPQGLVKLLNQNDVNIVRGTTAKIGNNFNTGWAPGDIRRAYLSDIDVGSVTGPELVTNGTFAGNSVTGWTLAANVSIVNERLTANSAAINTFTTGTTASGIANKTYRIEFDSVSMSGTVRTYVAGTSYDVNSVIGKQIRIITATADFNTIIFQPRNGSASFEIDNVSVREVVADRSYKAQGAVITGTLTKSQVASGASLVGYSGFSTTNYLQEPYSTDLDFGTGEWSASAWINFKPTRVNLLLKTEELSSTPSWTLTGVTTSLPGISVPYVMTEIKENLSSGQHKATNGSYGAPPIPSTISLVLKANGRTKVYVGQYDGLAQQELIDLDAGTITSNVGSYSNRSITPLGDGFYLVKFTSAASWGSFTISLSNGSTDTYVGDGTSGVYVGALQIEVGSVATTYQRVNTATDYTGANSVFIDRSSNSGSYFKLTTSLDKLTATAFDGTTTRTVTTATTTTATYNTAQWLKVEVNYTTDGSLAIRVNGREIAVTRGNPLGSLTMGGKNLVAYSESFDNGIWSKSGATIVPNFAVAPFGTTTADLMYPASNGSNRWIYQAVSGTTNIYSRSVYAKASGKSFLMIDPEGAGNNAAYFNLSTGAVATVSAGYTAEIQSVGDGWYRCTVRNNANQAISFGGVYAVVDADNSRAVTVNGTDGILLWGAQIEVGSLTSYSATHTAPLTIGNSYAADAPFPGSIALLKLSTTVPTPEQSIFMYEQEKQLFRANAVSVLPDAAAILDMSYDDATDRWVAISTANESYWNGLVRTSVTAVPVGTYSRIVTTSGVELSARITVNPGVDVTIPAYILREELVKRSEPANKLNRQIAVYDYIGGFTGNITTGSTAIASVTNLTYPVSLVGSRISGTGIPANTTITGVSGTTIYISAAATATTTGLVISLLDFNLPVGFETEGVTSAGVVKQEGATKDYTRLFDGFIETVRFAIAPGATTWVRIQVTKSIQ